MSARALAPGEEIPAWVLALDAAVFEKSWGPLQAQERLWMIEELAFARWSVIPAAGEAELLRLAVDPEQRRRGYAWELLDACEKAFRAEGFTALLLEVRASNRAAWTLYESLGWEQEGRRARYYLDSEDALLYRKRLG